MMYIIDYLSNLIFSTNSANGFFVTAIIFILLTIRAIFELGKLREIVDFFKKGKTIIQLILIFTWVYLIYNYTEKNKHSKDEKMRDNTEKLQISSKKAILALLIAFFARFDLVIAPFWLIWVMTYYLDNWV